MLRLGGWIGIALIAADGIKTRDRLQALLARIVGAGTLMALLGLAQFWTGESLIDWISLPGFVVDQSASGVEGRGGFVRPQGTAAHPLEYGVVLCVALPVAISLAMTDQKHSAVARWFPSSVIAFASMLSVSRSALLGVLAAALILSLRWSPSVRLYALLAAGGLGGIMYAVAPGMAGTLKGMFLGVADDPSTVSRTNSYATAFEIAERNPVLGRGFGTFLPQYLILDNQFLGLLIEIGVLGLAVFLVLVVTAMVIPWSATSRSADAVTRQMGSAISASVAATALTFAFFDGLGFPMSAGLLFLMIGLAGSLAEAGRSADMPSGVKVPPQVLKN